MTTLYAVSLAKKTKTCGHNIGMVRAIPARLVGHFRTDENDIVQPDMDAVRDCLPHYYRKAFDRNHSVWFTSGDNDGPAYVTLYDRRFNRLNTIYLWPESH